VIAMPVAGDFTYERSWVEIEEMLDKAEKVQNQHASACAIKSSPKKKRMYHARNFKALEGVVKTLRWVLGDKDIEHPLE
tara:strand:+ start:2724 stop:2960 length:237 start_codon:yes stop_codon:yes gene_type:complete